MTKYIDADAFLKVLMTPDGNENYMDNCGFGSARAISLLCKQPAADVKEVTRGEWRRHICSDIYQPDTGYCTNCGQENNKRTWFCPNCGADMKINKEKSNERSNL